MVVILSAPIDAQLLEILQVEWPPSQVMVEQVASAMVVLSIGLMAVIEMAGKCIGGASQHNINPSPTARVLHAFSVL